MAADILIRLLEGLTIAAVVVLVLGLVPWRAPEGGIALRIYAVATKAMLLAIVVACCIAAVLLIYILAQALVEAFQNGWGGSAYDPLQPVRGDADETLVFLALAVGKIIRHTADDIVPFQVEVPFCLEDGPAN